MKFTVFYMRPDFILSGLMGYAMLEQRGIVPTVDTLETTHIKLREVEAEDPEEVFDMMQGENWSPNGEARPLIQSLGLQHTSLSVGDIIRYEEDGAYEGSRILAGSIFMCDNAGWVFLGPTVAEA